MARTKRKARTSDIMKHCVICRVRPANSKFTVVSRSGTMTVNPVSRSFEAMDSSAYPLPELVRVATQLDNNGFAVVPVQSCAEEGIKKDPKRRVFFCWLPELGSNQ